MRESKIQKAVGDYAKSKGCLVYPLSSPSNNFLPDRAIVPFHAPIFLFEFKKWGRLPTKAQAAEHSKLRDRGVKVYVVDSIAHGKSIIDRELKRAPC